MNWTLLFIFSLLRIWRYPPKEGGLNVWQVLQATREERPHLPVEEAIRRATEAAGLDHHTGDSQLLTDLAMRTPLRINNGYFAG